MYILKQEQGEGFFYVLKDKEYVIGRKNADLIISDDQSLSRRHAIINTKGNTITLTDCKSKYGTFHNNVQLTANTDITLRSNDIIKFGVFQSIYRLENFPIVTTGSGLTQEQKNDLKVKLTTLGGSLVNTWDDSCAFLTANEIILTIKVLLALIEDKPIVNPQFWDTFLTNVKASKPLPNADDFKPSITETLLNKVDLSFNPARKELFKGKVFVFSSDKIKKKMSALINKTGGSSISWERQEVSLLDVTKSKNKYVFIYDVDKPEELPRSLKEVHRHVEKLGERTIPVQEIAMAVVLCSCEKDCNPKFNRVGNVFEVPLASSESEMYSLAADTQPENNRGVTKKEVIIPESLESDMEMFVTPVSVAKKISKSPAVPSVSKSPLKVEQIKDTCLKDVPSTSKHTRNEFGENEDNPSKRRRLENSMLTTCNGPSSSNFTQHNDLLKAKKRSAEDSLTSTPKKMVLSTSIKQKTSSEKRKSDEHSSSGKKKANPFVLTNLNKNKVNNPFATFKVKTEKADAPDNPFVQLLRQPRKDKYKQVELDNTFEQTSSSYMNDYTPSESSDIIWMSTSCIKNESYLECKTEVDLDPEIKEIFERFKDSVIVETMPATAFRTPVTQSTSASINTSIEGKNFKKFRKVQPRRPQTTILVTSFQQLNSHEISLRSDGESNENDEEIRRPSKSKSKSRFNF